jgi:hypothetical protein
MSWSRINNQVKGKKMIKGQHTSPSNYNKDYLWISYKDFHYKRVHRHKWAKYNQYGEDLEQSVSNPTIVDMLLDGAIKNKTCPQFLPKEVWPKVFAINSYFYVFKDMDSLGRCIILGSNFDKPSEVGTRREYSDPACFEYEVKNQNAVKAIASLVF